MEQLEVKLTELRGELKTYFDKAAEETKSNGAWKEETKSTIAKIQTQVDAIDVKLADRHAAGAPPQSVNDYCKENEGLQRLMKDRRGNAVLQLKGHHVREMLGQKTTITSGNGGTVGAATTGVLQIDRIPGITVEARETLKVRDLLPQRPTTMQVVDFVKVNAPLSIGSPQTEASDKAQNTVTFTSHSERVRTLATWIPATKQVLDDFTELMGFLQSSLPYYVNMEEELQLLSGSGSGEDLDGLITQATSFQTGLLSNVAGWNKIDIVGRAIQQIRKAKEIQPTFAVVNPDDWWGMRLQKDGFGRYILGDPQAVVRPSLFGLDVVDTTNIASGTFLVGSGNAAAVEIRDRMEMQVEISTEHSDYFTKNLIAIRAEKRLALIVKRPASFITGTFTTSP